jgi:hypothetical protein
MADELKDDVPEELSPELEVPADDIGADLGDLGLPVAEDEALHEAAEQELLEEPGELECEG